MNAKLYDFAAERVARIEDQSATLAGMDALECLKCGRSIRPHHIDTEQATHYRCDGPGHRAYGWRINHDGEMMRGLRGDKFYP